MTADRLNHLYEALADAQVSLLALNPGPTLTYLTGLHFHLMERPVLALFMPGCEPVLVLPELETAKLAQVPFPVRSFTYGEDPSTWQSVFRKAGETLAQKGDTAGVEATRIRFLEIEMLKAAVPDAVVTAVPQVTSALRRQKDAGELEIMLQAVGVAQEAFNATLLAVHEGMTERQLAGELTVRLLNAGSEPELPFSPIVASGPNSANPHASPTERKLAAGDLVVIDWGATVNGYCSDLTRTIAIKEVSQELAFIHNVVAQANAAGRAAVRPGVEAGSVDEAARRVIENAGYGAYFTHRTGHGLGMEAHEEPYIFAGNPARLAPGMTFTIEPGIYLPGNGGVRIEDNVVVTSSGSDSLSNLVRDLIVVG